MTMDDVRRRKPDNAVVVGASINGMK